MKGYFWDQLVANLDKVDADCAKSYLRRMATERSFFSTIANAIHEGIIVIDKSLQIKYFNVMAQELLGLPKNCISEKIDKIIKIVDWKNIFDREGKHFKNVRQEIVVTYPQHRFLNFYLMENYSEEDEDIFAVILLTDITESVRKNKKDVAESRLEGISLLAASVAHEIGNPLNNVNIHLQLIERLLRKDDALPEKVEKSLEVVKSEIGRLDTILSNFLKAIRPHEVNLKPQNIREIIYKSINLLKNEIENKSIVVVYIITEFLPLVLADEEQLLQAFYNLEKNAVNAMSENGKLQIIVKSSDFDLTISIKDDGCGISKEKITKIMDPFFTTNTTGNGLGLFVVERIVRSHGGILNIISDGNSGTEFQVILPLFEQTFRCIT